MPVLYVDQVFLQLIRTGDAEEQKEKQDNTKMAGTQDDATAPSGKASVAASVSATQASLENKQIEKPSPAVVSSTGLFQAVERATPSDCKDPVASIPLRKLRLETNIAKYAETTSGNRSPQSYFSPTDSTKSPFERTQMEKFPIFDKTRTQTLPKARSMTSAEMAAEMLPEDQVAELRDRLKTEEPPLSLQQTRQRRMSIKSERKASIDFIKSRTNSRKTSAASMGGRPVLDSSGRVVLEHSREGSGRGSLENQGLTGSPERYGSDRGRTSLQNGRPSLEGLNVDKASRSLRRTLEDLKVKSKK